MYNRYSVFLYFAPCHFLKIGTFKGVPLIGFWQGWEFALCTFALCSLGPWANCSRRTLLKSDMSDLLLFTSLSLFPSQKMTNSLKKIMFSLCFWRFFTAFPHFYAQKQIAPATLYKIAMCVICSFHEWMLFRSFAYKKRAICSKNHERVPNPGFWTKI